jgi:hypothetical protein
MKRTLICAVALASVVGSVLASGTTPTAATPAPSPVVAAKPTCFVERDKAGNDVPRCVSWLLGATLPAGGLSFDPSEAEDLVGNLGFNARFYKQTCSERSEIFAWLSPNPREAFERFSRSIKLGMINPLKTGETRGFFTARDWTRRGTVFGTAYFPTDGVIVALCQLR